MLEVERIMNDPLHEVLVQDLFTDSMFRELIERMHKCNIVDFDLLDDIWSNDYRNRKAIAGFLMDTSFGDKRLISMPDRITNTIQLNNGQKLYRPTVINAYNVCPLYSLDVWWAKWTEFMFETPVEVFCQSKGQDAKPQLVFNLIGSIHRKKYPAITVSEQAISKPLQVLCLAIVDAVFVHVANRAAPLAWEPIRQTVCDALIRARDDRICEILCRSYTRASEVIFLQEASSSLVLRLRGHRAIAETHALLLPDAFDGRRGQNSLILLSRRRFPAAAAAADVTGDVLACVEGDFLQPGDLFAASAEDASGRRWLLASFHGDSDGLRVSRV